jgi:hypothetical protein
VIVLQFLIKLVEPQEPMQQLLVEIKQKLHVKQDALLHLHHHLLQDHNQLLNHNQPIVIVQHMQSKSVDHQELSLQPLAEINKDQLVIKDVQNHHQHQLLLVIVLQFLIKLVEPQELMQQQLAENKQ